MVKDGSTALITGLRKEYAKQIVVPESPVYREDWTPMGYRNRKLISSFGKDTRAVLDFAKQPKGCAYAPRANLIRVR